MEILNLYAGIGGNRKYWQGHNITAVEYDKDIAKKYQELYPNDKVIITDAHEYLKDHYREFDFIWTSPPCQTHTGLLNLNKGRYREGIQNPVYPDMALWQEIIFLKHFSNVKYWIVENIMPYYECLVKPSKRIGRHYFWSNFTLPNLDIDDSISRDKGYINGPSHKSTSVLKEQLGFNTEIKLTIQELRNCVDPIIGQKILENTKVRQEVLD